MEGVIIEIDGRLYQFNSKENRYEEMVPCRAEEETHVPEAAVEKENVNACNLNEDRWSDEETRYLLEKYELYMVQVGPKKRYKNKSKMWEKIAQDLQIELFIVKTALQVKNRYNTILRRKKTAVDNNVKSGHTRMQVPFEDELRKIAAVDDSITPEVLRSANSVKYLKSDGSGASSSRYSTPSPQPSTSSSATSTGRKRRIPKQASVQETLRGIHQEREAAKKARHNEKMEFLKTLFGKD